MHLKNLKGEKLRFPTIINEEKYELHFMNQHILEYALY